jgi:hypothetical protein
MRIEDLKEKNTSKRTNQCCRFRLGLPSAAFHPVASIDVGEAGEQDGKLACILELGGAGRIDHLKVELVEHIQAFTRLAGTGATEDVCSRRRTGARKGKSDARTGRRVGTLLFHHQHCPRAAGRLDLIRAVMVDLWV